MKKIIIAMLALLMLVSCSGSDTVATVGKTKITRGEFEFYLDSIKSQMKGTELGTEEDWETQEIEGEKAIDVAKERALDIAVKNAEYREIAELAGLTLSEEEKNAADSLKKQIVASYGGEKGYKKYLKENGLTDKFIDMMCLSSAYYSRLGEYVTEKNPITDEALEAKFQSYIPGMGYLKAKHILFLTVDPNTNAPLSEEEVLDAKNRAEDILRRAESGEDFDALMYKYSEDPGLSSNPDGYVFRQGSGEMVAAFERAVASADPKGVAFCESEFGYHIIKRLTVLKEDVEDDLRAAVTDELIELQLDAWEKEFDLKITTNEKLLKQIK